MGRHAGWIAGASSLAATERGDAPHIILFPEIAFDQTKFLSKVSDCVKRFGYCVVVASEGTSTADGRLLADQGETDAFGHAQLGGLAPLLASMVKEDLGFKYHWAVADYLQRAARHIASQTDVDQAIALGRAAVELALEGANAIMPNHRAKARQTVPMAHWHRATGSCRQSREENAPSIYIKRWVCGDCSRQSLF